MGPSCDGKEVVLTGGVQVDVFFDQHFTILIGVVEGPADRVVLGVQSLENLLDVHLGNPFGGSGQAVIRQVQAQSLHDFPKQRGDACHLFLIGQCKGISTHRGVHRRADVVVANGVIVGGFFECTAGEGIGSRHDESSYDL